MLDKHPNYANYMELIKELCPNARFIHIIRDGRQVALSMMSVSKRIGHSAGDIRQAAKDWHRFVSNASNSGRKMNDSYYELRYEDLVNKEDTLENVFSFFGLSANEESIASIREKFDPAKGKLSSGDPNSGIATNDWKQRMPLKERYVFDRMAGKLLVELGYAENGWWSVDPMDKTKMSIGAPFVKARRAIKAFLDQLRKPLESDLSND